MYQEKFTFNNAQEIFNNIKSLTEECCDHVTIKVSDFCYYLIVHGCEEGFVTFNKQIVNYQELNYLFRKEQNLPITQNICVNVFCCFGATQQPYIDEHTQITSMYNNNSILHLNARLEQDILYCLFEYHNAV